jgi:hypothetical protein
VGQIVAIIGRVGVRGAKVVIRWVRVRSLISGIVAAGSDRAVLRTRALRRVLVLESWRGYYEVEGRTWMVPREFSVDAHASAYGGSVLLGNCVQPIWECPWQY